MGKVTIPIVALPAVMPKCWDSQVDWKAWSELNKRCAEMLGPTGKLATYCADCTPEYQRAMKAQNRCGYPGTVFITLAGTKQFVGKRR